MNGYHYIGSHADNEKQLVIGSPIVSISFGGTRTFRIRDKNKKIVKDFELKNKDIIIMGGTMQKEFKHEIVKVNGQKGLNVDKRINITFRQFI